MVPVLHGHVEPTMGVRRGRVSPGCRGDGGGTFTSGDLGGIGRRGHWYGKSVVGCVYGPPLLVSFRVPPLDWGPRTLLSPSCVQYVFGTRRKRTIVVKPFRFPSGSNLLLPFILIQ